MLPIVERELRVAARNPKLHSRRLRWGIVQAATACAVLLFSGGGFRRGAAESFFDILSRLALVLCLLEGVRKTSDAISAEKREGTLGFLFLSTLSGFDVVLGKFAGAFIRSFGALLPFFPILAISLLVGGTTLGEFWRVALALVSTLIMALAVCLLISTFSREASASTAIVMLGLLCIAPLAAGFVRAPGVARHASLLSPFRVLGAAGDLAYRGATAEYWTGISLQWGLALIALAVAALVVPRVWHDRPKIQKSARARIRESKRRLQLLAQNPVLWLNYNRRGHRWLVFLSIFLLAAGLLPLIPLWMKMGNQAVWVIFPGIAAMALLLVVWLRVAVLSATDLAEARRDGSLELLLSTPLGLEEVIKGYWLALWRTVRVPAVCVFILLVAAFAAGPSTSIGQAMWTSKVSVELLLEIVVLGSVGMWMGLKCKTRAAAVVSTILLGGMVPWMVCIFSILVQIVLILRGLDQVKAILRRVRNCGSGFDLPSLVIQSEVGGRPAPPVIRS